MQTLKKLISYLFSPSAIGIFMTLVFTAGAFFYYLSRDLDNKNILQSTLEFIHLKTIDFRMISRGPRKGSPRVAILDIDEKSLQVIGRWPWPRKSIAQVVDGVMQYDPAVISFDIVFSEQQQNPVANSLNRLKNSINVESPELDEFIDQEIQDQNHDLKLAEVVEKHADRLVMGTFFENEYYRPRRPYQSKCKSAAYSLTRGAEVFDNEEVPPIVLIENDLDLPEPLFDFLVEKFEETADEVTESFLEGRQKDSVTDLTQSERDILEFDIYIANVKYCGDFLTDKDLFRHEYDDLWPDVVDDDEDYEGLSVADGIERIRRSSLFNPIAAAEKYYFSIPSVAEVTKHTGFFVANQDEDGTIRTAHLLSRIGGSTANYLLPISFKAYLVATDGNAQFQLAPNPYNFSSYRVAKIQVNDSEGKKRFEIPVDSKGNMRINYAGERHMFPYISSAEFLNDDEMATINERNYDEESGLWISKPRKVNKAEWVKDKIFLFGPSATGIMDLRVTPFEKGYPGVETHANVLDNILRQDFLRNFPNEAETMIWVLLISGITLSVLIGILGALPGLLITFMSMAGFVLADYHFFFSKGVVTTIFFPVTLTFAMYVGLTFYKYLTEERKKKELKGTFSKYVSPAIVDEILKDPENIELGGKKQRITVFFSDVRGFTTISEKLDPQALSDLLNSYLTPMTELVFEHKGTLDKYMGDAIMAFFGAPITFEDHAKHACRCALEHLEKLKELQKGYEAQGLPALDVGIGLNTGDCSVGNMGSNTVRSYTVMGDAVNLGSRLEGINKQYGTRIIISEFTYEDVKDDFVCREIDWVKVKGKEEPVRIFELVGESKAPTTEHENMLKHFTTGFDLYHQKQFEKAVTEFNSALEVMPDDFCSKLYLERCQDYLENPPPENWDGVFTMTTK